MTEKKTHQDIEEMLKEDLDWPQFYVVGEGVDAKDFVPAYYKVEGPNGPVSYMNPNDGPFPSTMYDFTLEAQSDSSRWCYRSETPWVDNE